MNKIKVKKGQERFDFVTYILYLFNNSPGHLKAIGIDYDNNLTWHHLTAFMIIGCLSDLEAVLDKYSWREFNIHVDEFEVFLHIRNAYIHCGSDLSMLRDLNGFTQVKLFLNKLSNGDIIGTKGQIISPYFTLEGSI